MLKKENNTISFYQHASIGVSSMLRNDYADYDYLDKLNDKELKWLKKFHHTYIQANSKKGMSRKKRKEIFDANNSRNRDLYNIKKWTHGLSFIDFYRYKRSIDNVFDYVGRRKK